MKFIPSILLFGCVAFVVDAAAPPELAGDEALKKSRETYAKIMVMFYAPWCPHCQDAKPKYNEAFTKITDKTTSMAYVNCDDAKNNALCNTEKIEGFPTIKVFQKGKDTVNFEGDFTPDAFLQFLKDPVAAPPAPAAGKETPDTPMTGVTYLNTAEEFKTKVATIAHGLVFYYAPWCPHCQDAKPKYAKAAEELNKKGDKTRALFAVNCDIPVLQAFCTDQKVEGFPTLRYYHKGEMFAEFEEEMETASILKMINNPPKTKVAPTPVEEDKTGTDKAAAAPGAESPEGKPLTDADRQPEKPADLMKEVTYLTGATADETLKKHPITLVKFYAPWCPHCMDAKPIYDGASAELKKKNANVLMAAINCDSKENEKWCETQKVEGFPTLALFYKGKNVKTYEESPPTKDGIVKFMTSPPIPKEEL